MLATPRSDLDSRAALAPTIASSRSSTALRRRCSGASVARPPRVGPRRRRSDAHPGLEAPAAADPRSDPARRRPCTFFGRGYGHGVGMSQYGARGRALAGQTAATILAHYYQGTTLGSIPTTTPIRVRVLSGWTATPAAPLLVYGRLAAWTVDGIAAILPGRRAPAPDPDDDLDGDRPANDLARCASPPRAAPSCTTRRSRPASSFAARRPAACSSCGPSRRTYDRYRGALRIIASSTTPTVNVVNELPPRDVPARRRPGRDAVDLADRRRSRPRRSPPARMPRAACARASRTTTSPTTRARRSTTGRSARRRRRTPLISATAGVVLRSGSGASPTRCSIRPAAARPRTTRTSTCRRPARRSPARSSYLRGSSDRAPDGSAYDAASPYATWATQDLHRGPAVGLVRRRRRGRTSGR